MKDRRKALKSLGLTPAGSHAFIKTLDEHNAAMDALVRGWRDRLKRMVDASPNIDWRKYHSLLDDMNAFLKPDKYPDTGESGETYDKEILSEGEAGGLTD